MAPGSPPAAGYATPTPTHATPAARSTRAQGRPPLRLSQHPTGEAGGGAAREQARLASPRLAARTPSGPRRRRPTLPAAFGAPSWVPSALPRPWEGRRAARLSPLSYPLFSLSPSFFFFLPFLFLLLYNFCAAPRPLEMSLPFPTFPFPTFSEEIIICSRGTNQVTAALPELPTPIPPRPPPTNNALGNPAASIGCSV